MLDMKIIPFGPLTDIISKTELDIDGVTSVGQLRKHLVHVYPCLEGMSFSLAVNNTLSGEDGPVSREDTISLLPPFSGG